MQDQARGPDAIRPREGVEDLESDPVVDIVKTVPCSRGPPPDVVP
jgi:hypothetical protein